MPDGRVAILFSADDNWALHCGDGRQNLVDVHEKHWEAMEKGIGLLLAAAGSAIGFALHETADRAITPSLYVVGAAVLVWCGSFAAGVFRHRTHENALQANTVAQIAAKLGASKEEMAVFEARFDRQSNAGANWSAIQLWALLLGAVIYLAGHAIFLREQQAGREATNPAPHPTSASVVRPLAPPTKR
jgi:protein-S-isoprenylcysteine O-methyltransferase Ste14